jgi:hypothetical protein
MSSDERIFLSLVVSFSALATAHVALVIGLAIRPPRWRALVALPIAPLAPYWGARAGMPVRAVVWALSAIAYLTLRVVARR